MIPFQAVVVRYVHDTSVDEFLNIGLVVFAPDARFAEAMWVESWSRITHAFHGASPPLLRRIIRTVDDTMRDWRAAQTELALAPISTITQLMSRAFALDDASIRLSPVISGITADPRRSLQEFFEIYVGKQSRPEKKRPARDDRDVWNQFASRLEPSLLHQLHERVVTAPHLKVEFDHAWQNGVWNLLKPLSFDMNDRDSIETKATTWVGRVTALAPALGDNEVVFLVGLPGEGASRELKTAAHDAVALLSETLARSARVVTEDEEAQLAQKIVEDLAHHKTRV